MAHGGGLRGRISVIGLLAGLVLVVSGATAQAASTRYAEPGGDGPAATCPEVNPCGFSQAVIDPSVVDNDVVLLLPGTYNLGAASVNIADAITVKPRDAGTRPVIAGTANTVIALTDDATIQDLTITSTTSGGGNFAGTLSSFSGGAIMQRLIVETTSNRTGNLSNAEAACIVNAGTIRDSTCHAIAASSDVAVFGLSSANASPGTYQTNVINVVAWGTKAAGAFSAAGITIQAIPANVHATMTAKNLIAHAEGGNTALAIAIDASSTAVMTLANSNFVESSSSGTGASITNAGTGANQTVAPSLVDPTGGDFHQVAGSVTIDHGATDALLGTTDTDFEARSQNGVPDIGADEFNIPATPSITATTPTSPADNNSPLVRGASDAGTTVTLYGNPNCSGTSLGSGSAAAFASPGLAISVADNTVTELHAVASDTRGHLSGCSAAFNYVESTASPPGEQPPGQQPPGETPPGIDGSDTDPPQTKIKSGPDKVVKTRRRKVTFEIKFTADEDATFVCELDDEKAKKCGSPFKGKVGGGFHLVEITATDLAGNEEHKPAKVKWRVKRTNDDD